ncbi:amidase [Falsirhodobacter algicola]|uniref:Amidase n=1 Tax=Falsirhodobacter algicola TaxID=2692330 RepID=A0A8J8MU75_9RHOB|nr:amidase [Falsirhodobacter algicola]QUS36303.1 amidase [Falsirhodobacter algicola]
MTLNKAETLATVTKLVDDYEAALVGNDVDTLDRMFWDSAHTVRYGATECLYGQDEILAFRKGRNAKGIARTVTRRAITTIGDDLAIANLEFRREGELRTGRQSQTWARFPEGWRVISAHVSWMDDAPGAKTTPAPDPFDAFVPGTRTTIGGGFAGRLAGRTFGVKDIFDVKGLSTGCGHPLRREQAAPSPRNASCVDAVLREGATCIGKTHTDELAYSLNGENWHYGTPVNPAAKGRIPGGSSSGSAVAVAGGLVDFAIGSDTGGSVRVPASYCGVWGMRPTHGVIPMDGAMPFAPSFDSVGWFAADPELLRDVGTCLLPRQDLHRIRRILVLRDGMQLLAPEAASALEAGLSALRGLPMTDVTLCPDGLTPLATAFRYHQGYEIWEQLGGWIRAHQPTFGPGIADRFVWASGITAEEFAQARALRAEFTARIRDLCAEDTLLVLPTVPDIAPLLGQSATELEDFRNKALQLLCIAGLAGLPQINMPLGQLPGGPIGLSIIGAQNNDRTMLRFVHEMARSIMPQPEVSDR